MTPGERKWLERLRIEGIAIRPRFGAKPMVQCVRKGWSEMFWRDAGTKEELTTEQVVARKFQGVETAERLTDAGKAALEGS
jgi:hypothetical protein